MAVQSAALTGVERTFEPDEVIVSKTDPTGRITYANDIFINISGYTEEELLGQPHNILRHPDMPRCVFKFLWDRIADGHEVFAHVINKAKNGDHYWVFAHITPCFDGSGKIAGYHSTRRVPTTAALEAIKPVYAQLRAVEDRFPDRKAGMAASLSTLVEMVTGAGVSDYDRFVLSISR
ncbi:aerotaxis receptor [mine drainage metagenome]|uniref:Aerotaxis receptor n=1 Tax=mine drainage metagenome TaxID=410659 RepID=A0A1J5RLQ6_9ZZZZ